MEKAKADHFPSPAIIPNPKARLLDQAQEVIRVGHCSIRTEEAYEYQTRWLHLPSLPIGFVKEHRRRVADVERIDAGRHRDGHCFIASIQHLGSQTVAF